MPANRWDEVIQQKEAGTADVGASRWDPVIERTKPQAAPPYQEDLTPPGGQPVDIQAVGARTAAKGQQFQAGNEDRRAQHWNTFLQDNNLTGNYGGVEALPQGLTFLMARSRSPQDMREKFEQKFPEGDLIPAPGHEGGNAFLFRKNADDAWHELDTSTPGFIAGKVVTPQVAASVGAAVATGGMSVPAQAVGQLGAVTAGALADYGLEKLGGYAKGENVFQAGGEALKEGVGAGLVQGATGVPGFASRVAEGYRKFKLSDLFVRDPGYGRPYVESAERQGLAAPTVGQISGDPKIRTTFNQVTGTSAQARDVALNQNRSLQSALERRVAMGNNFEGTNMDLMERLMQAQEDGLMMQLPATQGASKSEAGTAVRQGLDNFKKTSADIRDANYKKADVLMKEDEGAFNIQPLKNEWEAIKRGTWGPSAKRTSVVEPGTEMVAGTPAEQVGVRKTLGLPTNETTIPATPATEVVTDAGVQITGPSREIARIGALIEGLSPELQNFPKLGKTDSALRQLTGLRSGLYDLMTSSTNPSVRRDAAMLWGRTKEIMDTPIGATPEAKAAIANANEFNAQREAKLALFQGELQTPRADNLGWNLIRPGNNKALATLKAEAPDQFDVVADAYRTNLLRNPENIRGELKKFRSDPETLGMVIPPEEQQVWESYGRAHKAWQGQKVQKALAADYDQEAGALDILFGGPSPGKASSGQLDQLIRTAGGPDSPTAKSLRAGVYKHILDQSMVTEEGHRILNPAKVRSMVDDLTANEQKRLSPIMGAEDWQALQDFATYASMLEGSKVSGQLQTAGVLSTLRSPVKFIRSPEHYAMAAAQVVNNETFARILSNPASSALFRQAAEEGPTPAGIRKYTAALAVAYKDFTKDQTSE